MPSARRLIISSNFTLPRQAVTETIAILGKRGVGKTHTAVVFVEELLEEHLPVVILDPVGVWWGLRSSKSGKSAGYPITVFGGEHADVPLEPTAGKYIAKLVAEEHVSCILDLSLFRKGARKQFVTDFAEELYRLNREPLQVVIDEADSFAPQKAMHGDERMLGAVDDLVRRGRARGLGVCMVTQRTAVINKNVLSQVEMLIVLRTLAPQDRKAIEAWTDVHGDEDKTKEMMASLPRLQKGHAWLWWPENGIFRTCEIRERRTFDSSATPKVGKRISRPKKLAPIDLKKIQEQMKESIERVRQEDPAELRKEIAKLRQLLLLASKQAKPEAHAPVVIRPKIITKEKPVLSNKDLKRLEKVSAKLEKSIKKMEHWSQNIGMEARGLSGEILDLIEATKHPMLKLKLKLPSDLGAPQAQRVPLDPHQGRRIGPRDVTFGKLENTNGEIKLLAGEKKILKTLAAVHPGKRTKTQVGTLSGYTASGGTFSNYFGRLRREELIHVDIVGDVTITDRGFEVGGLPPTIVPATPAEVRQMWLSTLSGGEVKMLQHLIDIYPDMATKEELGEATGYTSSGGTFSNYLGTLRRNALIASGPAGISAAEALFATV